MAEVKYDVSSVKPPPPSKRLRERTGKRPKPVVPDEQPEAGSFAARVGSLEVGKDASLFVSSGNALDSKSNNVERAFIQGRTVSLKSRQTELSEKYRTRYQQR